MAYGDWPGLQVALDRTSNKFWGFVADARETGTPDSQTINNSSYGIWDINPAGVNLYDGNWHTLVVSWAMDDDGISYPYAGKEGLSA